MHHNANKTITFPSISLSVGLLFRPHSLEEVTLTLFRVCLRSLSTPRIWFPANTNFHGSVQGVSACLRPPLTRLTSANWLTGSPKAPENVKFKYKLGEEEETVTERRGQVTNVSPVQSPCNMHKMPLVGAIFIFGRPFLCYVGLWLCVSSSTRLFLDWMSVWTAA